MQIAVATAQNTRMIIGFVSLVFKESVGNS